VCVIELGQFLFSYESGSLVTPDFLPVDGLPQPRSAADETVAWATRAATATGTTTPDRPPVKFRPGVTRADAGFFSWDMIANEVVCEPGTYGLHGLPEDGPATMETFLLRVPEEDRADLITALRHMMSSCGTYQIEYRVAALDGSLRSMEARGRVMPGPDGQPARLSGFVMDTTTIRASREAEQRLRRSSPPRSPRRSPWTPSTRPRRPDWPPTARTAC
jgi:PAS domain-containing protein